MLSLIDAAVTKCLTQEKVKNQVFRPLSELPERWVSLEGDNESPDRPTRHLILRPFLDPRSAEQSQQSFSVVRGNAGHLLHAHQRRHHIMPSNSAVCANLKNWSWVDGLSRRLWGVAIRKPPGLSAQNLTLTVISRRRVVLPLVQKTPQSAPTPIPPRKNSTCCLVARTRAPKPPVTLLKSGPKRAVALAQTVTHLKQLEVLVD